MIDIVFSSFYWSGNNLLRLERKPRP